MAGSILLALLGAVSVVALPFSFQPVERWVGRGELAVLAAGIAFGIGLWFVAVLDGDAFFHLARVRKLVDLGVDGIFSDRPDVLRRVVISRE